jgi:tRNA threonylcarbamoyladenosine biosynthesis protein TsaB
MTLLAIETASDEVAVAFAGPDGPHAHLALHAGRRHIETLHGAIDSLRRVTGIGLRSLSAVAVDVGPGLFTGIRVGVASAKAFATALGVPVVPATSLEVLALAAGGAHPSCTPSPVVVPVVDMRRGEIAWTDPESGEMRLGGPSDLVEALSRRPPAGPLLLAGDGALRHRPLIREEAARAGLPLAPPQTELVAPPVLTLSRLAVARLAAGGGVDPRLVLPCYLREADVRINWESRHEAPGPAVAGAPVAATGGKR